MLNKDCPVTYDQCCEGARLGPAINIVQDPARFAFDFDVITQISPMECGRLLLDSSYFSIFGYSVVPNIHSRFNILDVMLWWTLMFADDFSAEQQNFTL